MSEFISAWSDLVLLGSAQNLPLLLVALLLDRLFVRLAWVTPRRVVWAIVVVELVLPPALGAPLHVAGDAAVKVPLAAQVAAWWPAVLFVTWMVGSSLLATCFAVGARRQRRVLMAGARALPESLSSLVRDAARRVGLSAPPHVVMSAAATVPCVLGVLRPVVLVDAATLTTARPEQLEHALLHEFGHIKRRDALRALVVKWFVCSWWFHPSAWSAARRFAFLREAGCDQLVTSLLGARTAYCRTLSARALDGDAFAAPALVRAPADVVQRVMALRTAGKQRGAMCLTSLLATILLLMCCVPMTSAAASHLPFGFTSIADMPGCLTKRYFVLSQMPPAPNTSDVPTKN